MALLDATLNELGDSLAALLPTASLHTANPGTTGANESTAARQALTWTVDADGDLTLSVAEDFTGGTPSGPCTYVGFWNGTTFKGSLALTGDQTFNAAGEYTLNNVTFTIG